MKPSIRFKGFTDAWEQRKLDEYLEVSLETNNDNSFDKSDVLSVSGEFGVVNQIEFQGRSFAGESVAGYGVLRTHQVVYTKSPLKSNPYGIIKTNKGKAGIVSVLYGVYQAKEDICPELIQTYFEQDARLNNYLKPLVNKGAKNTLLISDQAAISGDVIFPEKYVEQTKIYGLFDKIDTIITLHQRKCDKLQDLKKSLLEKMFPAEGSNTPSIRFKGFTDAWEQRKFSDLYVPLVERNSDLLPYNKTLSVATMTYKTDGNGAAYSSLANYKRLRTGDIAFEGHTSKSFRYGRFVLNDVGDGIMSPRFSALRPLAQMPKNFWKYYIHYEPIMRKILVASTKAGTMMNELVIDEFLKSSVLVPPIEEQTRIGSFLKNIDNLITLHQRKCEKLKNIKKSLLEKMFV